MTVSKLQSEPDNGASEQNDFGYHVIQGTQKKSLGHGQEDIVSWQSLEREELFPKGLDKPLTPTEIGFRLWTSYQLLDEQGKPSFSDSGTTATTTVYDGVGNLITATLGDPVSFAVIYDKEGNPLAVTSLNSEIHMLDKFSERKRLQLENQVIPKKKTNGKFYLEAKETQLRVSRTIGDIAFKNQGICSEAKIDITSIKRLLEKNEIDSKTTVTIQIISTSNGFTDGAKKSNQDHADYLLQCLKNIDDSKPGTLNPNELARKLVENSSMKASRDDIAVAITNIQNALPSIIGVYDGHYGNTAAKYVANNISKIFKALCALKNNDYSQQPLSAYSKKAAYNRDNKINPLRPNSLSSIVIKRDSSKSTSFKEFVEQAKSEQASKGDVLVISCGSEPFAAYIPQYDVALNKNDTPSTEEIQEQEIIEIRIKDKQTIQELDSNNPNQEPSNIETQEVTNDQVEAVLNSLDIPLESPATEIVKQLKKLTTEYQESLLHSNSSVKNNAQEIVKKLLTIFDKEDVIDTQKIRDFYSLLNKTDNNSKTNLDIIKQDKTVSAANFIKGIIVISAIVLTGIIPGIVVCLATGKSPFSFFKSNVKEVEKFENGVAERKTL